MKAIDVRDVQNRMICQIRSIQWYKYRSPVIGDPVVRHVNDLITLSNWDWSAAGGEISILLGSSAAPKCN
jgi:hypothetical protein